MKFYVKSKSSLRSTLFVTRCDMASLTFQNPVRSIDSCNRYYPSSVLSFYPNSIIHLSGDTIQILSVIYSNIFKAFSNTIRPGGPYKIINNKRTISEFSCRIESLSPIPLFQKHSCIVGTVCLKSTAQSGGGSIKPDRERACFNLKVTDQLT